LLISISSDVIAALESEPPEDKAADRAALIGAGRRPLAGMHTFA
jgi:hypothetical protein